jgi:hypothetical protein
MPRQKSGTLSQTLADEILVYDSSQGVAHGLNPTAAIVWACCDGVTLVAQVEEKLAADLGLSDASPVLLETLRILRQKSLLEGPVGRLPRRQVLKRLGLAAALLPVVSSALAPRPAAAVSCGSFGAPCKVPQSQDSCCPELFCLDGLGGPVCSAT